MQNEAYKILEETSFLDGDNATYLEQLYEAYLQDSHSVPVSWCRYFSELKSDAMQANDRELEAIHSSIQDEFRRLARTLRTANNIQPIGSRNLTSLSRDTYDTKKLDENAISRDENAIKHERKQIQVGELIEAYRLLGHLHADIDPLSLRQKPLAPELFLSYYQLSEKDLDTLFDVGTLLNYPNRKSLQQIIQDLKTIYCGSIAFEFMHIPDITERAWVQEKIEKMRTAEPLGQEIKLSLLKRISEAEGLEKYLGAKYPGAKRFSLEGLDSFIVILDAMISQGGSLGIKEFVIGMAHRGRLNVLINIFGKSPSQLFDEFEGKHYDERLESGDVKYHQGFSSNVSSGKDESIHLSMAFNPSHLEIVTPVVCGSVRARQDRRQDEKREQVVAIAVHGDAAFAGQGIVMETLNMSRTRGFAIGGSVHIVMNNQIGFTTSNPADARSTLYCSDIGKMMEIPIFHVNANDPEAAYQAAHLALQYHAKFKKDVIIDLIGYRRWGHNEADEPAVTQPLMYQIIRKLPTVFQLYTDKLIAEGIIQKEDAEELVKNYRSLLDNRKTVREVLSNRDSSPIQVNVDAQPYVGKDWRMPTQTGVSLTTIKMLAAKIATLPQDFSLHPRVQKLMDERVKMTEGTLPLDWGYAEIMAYATLLNEGYPVRMTGQDCRRGTFFHRHAVLHDQKTGEVYVTLANLSETQGKFSIYDSLLSEEGVLAFEYGYSTTALKHLVIWEAQYGDFVNGAQIVIDQFISSGEQKWGRLSGLTLFLPHGYEGQGPEHSSARLERFLQLCAQHNIQVCTPTTPAQIFHLIRRQILRPMRKPLVVMSPKSLLRHKLAVSSLEELQNGQFLSVIGELDNISAKNVNRILLCGGKIYYDLLERRRTLKNEKVVVIRIEQLYPFPNVELQKVLEPYTLVNDIIWCQEEPENQGAWYCSQHNLLACLRKNQTLRYVGRGPAAAPAVGYAHLHHEQHEKILKDAFE